MQNEINKALEVLKNGGTILYPTDTIWGIGCDATNESAIARIFDIKKRVDEILNKVGLTSKSDNYPNELSGGEQQKVCVSRALIKKPKIVLADEPTGNLDPSASDDIIDLLENESNSGTTIIMATHNYPLIENRIKHFIEINEGKIVS